MRDMRRYTDRGLEENESYSTAYVSQYCKDVYECMADNDIRTGAGRNESYSSVQVSRCC